MNINRTILRRLSILEQEKKLSSTEVEPAASEIETAIQTQPEDQLDVVRETSPEPDLSIPVVEPKISNKKSSPFKKKVTTKSS